MNILSLFCILISVSCSVAAQGFLKKGMIEVTLGESFLVTILSLATNTYVYIGLTFYVASMGFWLYVLSQVEVSKAYPFVAIGFVGTLLIGYFFYDEAITYSKVFGISLIVAGVFTLALSK